MTEEVSNKTIALLMVVVILVSVIGTWLVLDNSGVKTISTSKDVGKVSFRIGEEQVVMENTVDTESGKVAFNIV